MLWQNHTQIENERVKSLLNPQYELQNMRLKRTINAAAMKRIQAQVMSSSTGSDTIICSSSGTQPWENISHVFFLAGTFK